MRNAQRWRFVCNWWLNGLDRVAVDTCGEDKKSNHKFMRLRSKMKVRKSLDEQFPASYNSFSAAAVVCETRRLSHRHHCVSSSHCRPIAILHMFEDFSKKFHVTVTRIELNIVRTKCEERERRNRRNFCWLFMNEWDWTKTSMRGTKSRKIATSGRAEGVCLSDWLDTRDLYLGISVINGLRCFSSMNTTFGHDDDVWVCLGCKDNQSKSCNSNSDHRPWDSSKSLPS